jgi:hypothetical protein
MISLNGFLHCHAGQKEALDAVFFILVSGEHTGKVDHEIKKAIFVSKWDAFQQAILYKAAHLSQNVHVMTYYEGKLRETLG